MFSGIVEGTGKVLAKKKKPGGIEITVDIRALENSHLKTGDSMAVNGVCLTVASVQDHSVLFNVITETLSKTNLGKLKVGSPINFEKSLRSGDLIHGHFVQGHVDGLGIIVKRTANLKEFTLWIKVPKDLAIYIPPRGSVAVNGVSLTVADVKKNIFFVALIPTTLQRTNLGQLKVGDQVNIETDLISRQIVHYLREAHS